MEQHQELNSIAFKRKLITANLDKASLCEDVGKLPWELVSNNVYQICEKPCVSVIVTLFNYSEYICECLNSVCKAGGHKLLEGIEIVVINDCSTDNSANIVEEYLRTSTIPICLVNKCFNTGLADTRNVGLKIARSQYVFILDADNLIHPNCLFVLYSKIKSSSYAAVYSSIRKFDSQTRKEVGLLSCYEWDIYKLTEMPYLDAMAMFNRETVLKVGGYSTELIKYGWFGWEDYDLWLKLARLNYRCKLIPKTLSSYRVHSSSMIHTTNSYILNVAKYFSIKFPELVEQASDSKILFGFQRSKIFSTHQPHFSLEQIQADLQEVQRPYVTTNVIQSNKWKLRKQWLKLKDFWEYITSNDKNVK